MTFQQLASHLQAFWPAQIPVQNTATWSGEATGERPQQVGLMQMVQQAVADDQIGTSDQLRQFAPLQILQRDMPPEHRQAPVGRALSRNAQHGFSAIHPHELSVGVSRRQRQRDISWPASEINEQRLLRQGGKRSSRVSINASVR